MRSTGTGRVLTVGVVVTALAWVGTGTAAATPHAGPGVTVTNDDYALAALSSAEVPDLAVFLDVFASADREPFADLEVFAAGYECVTGAEDAVPATMETLESASATGTLPLDCASPTGDPVTGEAVVQDVGWDGEGSLLPPEVIPPGPGVRCLLFVLTREATVTGTVRVTIPGLGIDADATGDRGQLRHVRGICPPERP
ncbi:hypothetical protein ACI78V_12835 [Geodermatophilus sp. SYSU D00742]